MLPISDLFMSRLDKIWLPPDFTSFFKKYSGGKQPILVKSGKTVFYEGDEPRKIYFIKKGFVKMYRMSPEGRSTIIYLYGPGSILAVRALTNEDKQLKHTAEAITDVEIVTISEKDYFEALNKNPEYMVDLLHVFIERLNYTERKLEGFILTDTTARVASFLYDLVERFGTVKNNSATLPVPLTHQTISEFVGAFRETVTVAINRLKKEGILEDKRGKITITNVKKLKQQALI
ncbi:MAG TPA: Crp/Fnr family transcriptional regulator [Patescibacteria group bacterium]|nr:Crp/Fnr family transcriptional regulator [Patescibacteria group bacterium]